MKIILCILAVLIIAASSSPTTNGVNGSPHAAATANNPATFPDLSRYNNQ
jgi:hypothetical protein